MTSAEDTIQAYLQCWNEPSPEKRVAQFRAVLADNFTYLDPTTSTSEVEALSQYVQNLIDTFPGLRGETYGALQRTGDQALFNWRFHADAGQSLFHGLDCVRFDKNGRIGSVVGFFDARVESN